MTAEGSRSVIVRLERPDDVPAVRLLNEAAFGQSQEAAIVDELRAACPGVLSLVAAEGARVVGHIFFSPVGIDGWREPGMGLAPMAVSPDHQRRGVGTMLVREGIGILRERKCPYVIVLGHPGYYPRFGFERASRYGLRSQWPGVPDEAFLALELRPGALKGAAGMARYRKEFDAAM